MAAQNPSKNTSGAKAVATMMSTINTTNPKCSNVAGRGRTVFERSAPDEPWRASTLTKSDILRMPEIGIEIPVTECYEDSPSPEEGEATEVVSLVSIQSVTPLDQDLQGHLPIASTQSRYGHVCSGSQRR
jgi:hypothetical protein